MEPEFKVGQILRPVTPQFSDFGEITLTGTGSSGAWYATRRGDTGMVRFDEGTLRDNFKTIVVEATAEELEEAKKGLLEWLN